MLQKKAPKNKKTKKEIRQKYWWNYSPPPGPQLRGPCMFAPEMTSNPVFDFDGERGRAVKWAHCPQSVPGLLTQNRYVNTVISVTSWNDQAPVVQTLDSAIHRIKIYPVDNAIVFPNTYPLDSDLSAG